MKPWEKYADKGKARFIDDNFNVWLASGPWNRYIKVPTATANPQGGTQDTVTQQVQQTQQAGQPGNDVQAKAGEGGGFGYIGNGAKSIATKAADFMSFGLLGGLAGRGIDALNHSREDRALEAFDNSQQAPADTSLADQQAIADVQAAEAANNGVTSGGLIGSTPDGPTGPMGPSPGIGSQQQESVSLQPMGQPATMDYGAGFEAGVAAALGSGIDPNDKGAGGGFTPDNGDGATPDGGMDGTGIYADGGSVQGPGSTTSDSIDAKLSDEEFVLPADVVAVVGVDKLNALIKKYHKPAKKGLMSVFR